MSEPTTYYLPFPWKYIEGDGPVETWVTRNVFRDYEILFLTELGALGIM